MIISRRLCQKSAENLNKKIKTPTSSFSKSLQSNTLNLTPKKSLPPLLRRVINRYLNKFGLISQSRELTKSDLGRFAVLKRKFGKRARFLYRNHKIDLVFSIAFIFSTNLAACFWWAGNGAGDFILSMLNKDYKLCEWAKRLLEYQLVLISDFCEFEGEEKLDLVKLLKGESHSGKMTQFVIGWAIFTTMENLRWVGYYFLTIHCIRRGYFRRWTSLQK